MRTVTIPQWGSIFSGKPALEGSTKHYRAKPDDMDRWLTLLSMLPKEVKYYVSKDGYFGAGYTARDAICNFVNSHYQPITDERLIVKCGDWYEAYIPYTDMVAALPIEIGKHQE